MRKHIVHNNDEIGKIAIILVISIFVIGISLAFAITIDSYFGLITSATIRYMRWIITKANPDDKTLYFYNVDRGQWLTENGIDDFTIHEFTGSFDPLSIEFHKKEDEILYKLNFC